MHRKGENRRILDRFAVVAAIALIIMLMSITVVFFAGVMSYTQFHEDGPEINTTTEEPVCEPEIIYSHEIRYLKQHDTRDIKWQINQTN